MDQPVLMSVVQTLLDNQAKNFKTTSELISGDLKNEMKELRKEISDLKISLQFTQAKHDEMVKKFDLLEKKTSINEQSVHQSFDHIEVMEDNVEYMENQNRRNNVKSLGMIEDPVISCAYPQCESINLEKRPDSTEHNKHNNSSVVVSITSE